MSRYAHLRQQAAGSIIILQLEFRPFVGILARHCGTIMSDYHAVLAAFTLTALAV